MKNVMRILLLLGINGIAFAFPDPEPNECTPQQKPQLVRPLDNWDIIASNIATINAAASFSGPHLIYSISYTPTQLSNKATINRSTGEISIAAASKDNFNMTVTAVNACGSATGTFNVQVDEEPQ